MMSKSQLKPITQLAGCAVTNEQGHILLLNRVKPGFSELEMPGGKVEPGESCREAAIREVREEMSVTVSIIKYLGKRAFGTPVKRYEYAWYQAKIVEGEPHICEPDKHDEIGFFDPYGTQVDMRAISVNMHNFISAIQSGEVVLDSV